jgi:predicted transcriptional regulator
VEKRKNKIYFTDSYGRVRSVSKSNVKRRLRTRLAKHVEPEVKEALDVMKKRRNEFQVKDVALELNVSFMVVRKILNDLVEKGYLKKRSNRAENIMEETYLIGL